MINTLKVFFAVAVPMLVLDAIWLTAMNKPFYAKYLASIMSAHPVWIAAGIFYVIYAIGVAVLIVSPALAGAIPWYEVALRGALFGLVAYATYDLTNHATVTNWPMIVTVVDMIWGTVLTSIASTVAYFILK
ncbi:MAG: DUF2177 family protein [bacterium]